MIKIVTIEPTLAFSTNGCSFPWRGSKCQKAATLTAIRIMPKMIESMSLVLFGASVLLCPTKGPTAKIFRVGRKNPLNANCKRRAGKHDSRNGGLRPSDNGALVVGHYSIFCSHVEGNPKKEKKQNEWHPVLERHSPYSKLSR